MSQQDLHTDLYAEFDLCSLEWFRAPKVYVNCDSNEIRLGQIDRGDFVSNCTLYFPRSQHVIKPCTKCFHVIWSKLPTFKSDNIHVQVFSNKLAITISLQVGSIKTRSQPCMSNTIHFPVYHPEPISTLACGLALIELDVLDSCCDTQNFLSMWQGEFLTITPGSFQSNTPQIIILTRQYHHLSQTKRFSKRGLVTRYETKLGWTEPMTYQVESPLKFTGGFIIRFHLFSDFLLITHKRNYGTSSTISCACLRVTQVAHTTQMTQMTQMTQGIVG